MKRPDDDLLDRWLRAEGSGNEDEAEAALTALFSALPLRAPAAGFADRVLLAARPAHPRRNRARSAVRSWAGSLLPAFLGSTWGRAGLAFGLVLAALGLPFLRAALLSLPGALPPDLLLPAAAHALIEASGWLLSLLRLGGWFAALSRSLLTPFESPTVAAALGACLLVSALALRLLHDVIHRERNWTYVDPI